MSSGLTSLLSRVDKRELFVDLSNAAVAGQHEPHAGAVAAVGDWTADVVTSSSSTSTGNPILSLLSSTLRISAGAPPHWIASACHDFEGWGPLSPYRDLGLTPCFLQSVLIAAPVALLALAGAADLARLSQKGERPLSSRSRGVLRAKEGVLGALFFLTALQLSLAYNQFQRLAWDVSLLSPLLALLGYLLVYPLQRLNHTRTRRASSVLLFFWLQQLLAHLLLFQHQFTAPPESPTIAQSVAPFVLLCIKVALLALIFGLECAGVEIGQLAPEQKEAYLEQRRKQLFEQRRQRLQGDAKKQANGNGNGSGNAEQSNGHLAADSAFSLFSDAGSANGSESGIGANGSGSNNVYAATDVEKECPINTSNIFSRLTFHWMQPMMTLGSRKFLDEEDMWSLPPDEDAESLGKRFAKYWAETRDRKTGKPRFWRTLAKSYGGPFLWAAVLKAAQDSLAFAQPQVLRKLLQFVQTWDQPVQPGDKPHVALEGYLLSLTLFLVAIVQTSFLHQYFQLAFVTGMRVRAGLVSAIYKKSLRLSNEERGKRATGDIVNLMSVDATRLQDLCTYGHITWSALFQMTLAFVSLYNLVGW